MKTGSPMESQEAAMLREVYLVLWAVRNSCGTWPAGRRDGASGTSGPTWASA